MNDELTQALASLMLVCAFGLLALRDPGAMATLYRIQSIALTAAAVWQGHVQHAPMLYLAALIILAVNGILLPRMLSRVALLEASAVPAMVLCALGIIPLGVAIIAVPAGDAGLAVPLGILLLGLLLAFRRGGGAQTAGMLVAGNALLLGAATLNLFPAVPEFAVALAALGALSFLFEPRASEQDAR